MKFCKTRYYENTLSFLYVILGIITGFLVSAVLVVGIINFSSSSNHSANSSGMGRLAILHRETVDFSSLLITSTLVMMFLVFALALFAKRKTNLKFMTNGVITGALVTSIIGAGIFVCIKTIPEYSPPFPQTPILESSSFDCQLTRKNPSFKFTFKQNSDEYLFFPEKTLQNIKRWKNRINYCKIQKLESGSLLDF